MPFCFRIWNYLVQLSSANNRTIILTTHYIEEARQSHRVLCLKNNQKEDLKYIYFVVFHFLLDWNDARGSFVDRRLSTESASETQNDFFGGRVPFIMC